VPTSIKLLGKGVISIWIDPSKVEEHYGNYPIYGVIELNEENEKVELNRTIS
jgi:hypothetical protein